MREIFVACMEGRRFVHEECQGKFEKEKETSSELGLPK